MTETVSIAMENEYKKGGIKAQENLEKWLKNSYTAEDVYNEIQPEFLQNIIDELNINHVPHPSKRMVGIIINRIFDLATISCHIKGYGTVRRYIAAADLKDTDIEERPDVKKRYSNKIRALKTVQGKERKRYKISDGLSKGKIERMLNGFCTAADLINAPVDKVFSLFDDYCLECHYPLLDRTTLSRSINQQFNLATTTVYSDNKITKVFVDRLCDTETTEQVAKEQQELEWLEAALVDAYPDRDYFYNIDVEQLEQSMEEYCKKHNHEPVSSKLLRETTCKVFDLRIIKSTLNSKRPTYMLREYVNGGR